MTVTRLDGALRAAAEPDPDRIFLRCSAEEGHVAVSFGELEDRSRRVAAGLLVRGLRRGDRVADAAPNQAEHGG